MLCRPKSLIPLIFSAALALILAPGVGVFAATSASAATQSIGVAEKVVGDVYGNDLLRRLQTADAVYRDQRIKAAANAAADLRFRDRSRLTVGPNSEVVLDDFVYDSDAAANRGTISLVRGVLSFASGALDDGVSFKTPSAVIGIRGTAIDVMVADDATEVVVHEGRVQVTGEHGSILLNAGESVTLTDKGPQRGKSGSPRIRQAAARMQALVDDPASKPNSAQKAAARAAQQQRKPGSGPNKQAAAASPAAASPAAASRDERALQIAAIRGKDPQDLLFLDLPYGRVIIEMREDLAPHHVARIKQLVRDKFYDGLAFHSVVPDRFAMTGDPTGTGHGGSGQTLGSEFSPEPFRRGSVGMAHIRGKPDSADSQFFISLETFPEISGKYTLWGQVIHGMQFIDQLRAGTPPDKPDTILHMSVAADVAG